MTDSSRTKKRGCLKGCLVLVAIFLGGLIVVGIFIRLKGKDIMHTVFDQTKKGVTYLLTEDHSAAEREHFQMLFSEFIDDLKSAGFQQGVQRHQDAVAKLQEIIKDQRITRVESQQWIEAFGRNT
jgi:hypothetical protein